MKHLLSYLFSVLLLGSTFIGCSDQQTPTDGNDEVLTPLSKVTVVEYTFEYDLGDEDPYEDCAGEDMQLHGNVLVHVRETTTPSGNTIVSGWVDYEFDQITMVGLTSGDIWMLTKGFNPFHEVYKESGAYLLNFQWHEFYSNEYGDKRRAFVTGHLHIDADGHVTSERESIRCF